MGEGGGGGGGDSTTKLMLSKIPVAPYSAGVRIDKVCSTGFPLKFGQVSSIFGVS